MITPTLQAAIPQFLAYFLQPLRQQSGGGPLSPADLAKYVAQIGPELEITLGAYGPYVGVVPHCAGVTFPATHALHVSRTTASVQPGGNDGIIVNHEESPKKPFPNKYFLRWIIERADVRVDGADTIRRVLRDLRPPSTWTAGGATGTGTPPTGGTPAAGGGTPPAPGATEQTYGGKVADAIGAMPLPRAIPLRIQDVNSVPPGLDVSVDDFKQILQRFFTYDSDGEYYAKWWSAGEGAFPEETTENYRLKNIETPALQGDNIFVVGNVPSNFGLPGQENRLGGEFREFIARIVPPPTGDAKKLGFEVVNSAVKTIEVGGTPARDLFDFCFFTVKPATDN